MAKPLTLVILDEAQARVEAANKAMLEATRMNFSEEGGRRLEAAIAEANSASHSLTMAVLAVVATLNLLEGL